MKKIFVGFCFLMVCLASFAQEFSIPKGAELLESTEFKDNGVPYMVEQRYRLPSGEIMYAYYDVEGSNSVTVQKIEQQPLLSISTEVNIPGMAGYREFNFGSDRRKLVQFMKMFKLGEEDYRGRVKKPSLGDLIFRTVTNDDQFKLLLDLYDESWVLEHIESYGYGLENLKTTSLVRVKQYSE